MHVDSQEEAIENLESVPRKIDKIFSVQQANRWVVAQTSSKERIAKLKRIYTWTCTNREEIRQALYADFNRAAAEVDILDIFPTIIEIKHAIRNLKIWMKPKKVRRTRSLLTTRSYIRYEPKGVVLIISPWNFPLMLAMGPLISAIAAGNCVILKPSELSPQTSQIIKKMISELFPENEVAVIEGHKEVAIELLKKPFNHIFFTGSSEVGKRVMQAAAENLSSITLELGGKSPVIIDASANLKDAAKKICWGKYMNTGQTCVAPDYIFVHEQVYDKFLNLLANEVQHFYGATESERQKSTYFGRIIDQRHFMRVKDMLYDATKNGAKILIGGITHTDEKYISPTILTDVDINSQVMEEEIFGPLLPILRYHSLDKTLELLRMKETPLAVYVFSKSKNVIQKVISHLPSGNVGINEVVVQFIQNNLPFGGINHSGLGNSHGFFGFKAFSHERAILRNNRFSPVKLVYPPYTKLTKKIIALMLRYLT